MTGYFCFEVFSYSGGKRQEAIILDCWDYTAIMAAVGKLQPALPPWNNAVTMFSVEIDDCSGILTGIGMCMPNGSVTKASLPLSDDSITFVLRVLTL
ncbi:hypothetical protein V7S43_011513 [Phytophthora oleae]|uniref:Uncharacterized protein n=1 Tax=Phytophthora oleae TaxID=2107226 RepID=A0ABD3FB14_9STRA